MNHSEPQFVSISGAVSFRSTRLWQSPLRPFEGNGTPLQLRQMKAQPSLFIGTKTAFFHFRSAAELTQ
ncbi:unnamed protein product [Protopolystoma xenopodis]|uniref:Uncharacterized protein n=1 Tax=Protopolystoma xenopodis TaxID=117903 RepID=A0A3S5BQU8_9PLAT|nr:unnamed protein product [Protopolystoma xenopodis]